jgi:drug/metabolite transporter (DMT)-like permease
VIGYSLCSSTMLLANKMALEHLPSPSTVSLIQIVFATVAVIGLRYCGVEVDWFDWERSKAYAMYVAIFVAAIYTNMQALRSSNVETVIVFRACSPIAVCVFEYIYLNRSYPTLRSLVSMLTVAAGAIFYCLSDSQLALKGISAYYWVLLYFVLITVEMTYGKQITSSVKMDSVWGPVLYCNAFSVVPMFLLSYGTGELHADVLTEMAAVPLNGWLVILFSCIVGTLIG